jgi:hypothetical protein
MASFVASEKCYYLEDPSDLNFNAANPCYQGDGFATLMKVGPEKTFQSVVIGLVTFIHAAYLLYIVKQGKADSTILDKMEGMGYMIILMLLITAVFWGSQRVLEQDFIIHGNTTEGEGGGTTIHRKFYPNVALVSTFAAQTWFSTLALLSEMGVVYALMFWKDDLIADSGSGFDGFENFSSGGNAPAPYANGAGASSEPAHYNDL